MRSLPLHAWLPWLVVRHGSLGRSDGYVARFVSRLDVGTPPGDWRSSRHFGLVRACEYVVGFLRYLLMIGHDQRR